MSELIDGFVYLWRDRTTKMFYVGSHIGTESDRYICGSPWMNNAYRKRPDAFKRRIIKRFTSVNSAILRAEELRFLLMIKPSELGNRYYNLKRTALGWDSEGARLTQEKIGPERRRQIALDREAKIDPVKKSEAIKRGLSKFTPEEHSDKARRGAQGMTSDARKKRARKAADARTHEQHVASALLGAERMGVEGRSARAQKVAAAKPPGWAFQAMQRAREALDMSAAAKNDRAQKAQAARSSEYRKEIGLRSAATRQASGWKPAPWRWITNQFEQKRVEADLPLPDGWMYGCPKRKSA